MPKKKRAASNATAAKQRRQATRRANIADAKVEETLAHWGREYEKAIVAGRFQARTRDGGVEELTLERIHAHMDAGLASDGELPLDKPEFIDLLWDDFRHGFVTLHDDGTWSFDDDYFADRGAEK